MSGRLLTLLLKYMSTINLLLVISSCASPSRRSVYFRKCLLQTRKPRSGPVATDHACLHGDDALSGKDNCQKSGGWFCPIRQSMRWWAISRQIGCGYASRRRAVPVSKVKKARTALRQLAKPRTCAVFFSSGTQVGTPAMHAAPCPSGTPLPLLLLVACSNW